MTTLRLDEVLRLAQQRPCATAVRIVAVDGPSGSGKSTLALRLAERSGAPVVAGDDFLSWPDFVSWWPRFAEQVLAPLSRGEDARYQARDWHNDEFGTSLGEWKTLPCSPLVIVEGTTCARREGGDAITFRVWVEAPEEVRLARGIARDGESHRALWLDWMKREREFFAHDRTRERADLRVNGAPTETHDAAHEVVLLGK